MDNVILLTDSYKFSHHKFYPPKTRSLFSYFESRGGKFDKTIFYGLQGLLKKYLVGKVITQEAIDYAAKRVKAHGIEFNKAGWQHILDKYEGYLPITIKAVPEGTEVPGSNVLMTVEVNDPVCFWLTNAMETLLTHLWYPTTVASLSHAIRKLILKYLNETGTPDLIDFKLHDFGFRGASSVESAGIGGSAHLLSFKGTDTFKALEYISDFYNEEEVQGFSIPATEHSNITTWGQDFEEAAYDNVLTQYPEGLVACVSDSYNIEYACRNLWGGTLKDKVMARNGTLVIRPDSGEPVPTVLSVLSILMEQFGYTMNDKGYKVLPPQVRVIQGDGVDQDSIGEILEAMKAKGYSADNIAFGMGGALLQKVNRDTNKFAFKACSINIDGKERDVFKRPMTDMGKASKGGRLALQLKDGKYSTTIESLVENDQLRTVFQNGKLLVDEKFTEIRARIKD